MAASLYHIPKPDNDELWELWCLKIFAKQYDLPGLTRYRTSGYPQEGIDLIGTRADGKKVGIQCKLRTTEKALTEREADADLDKWLASGLNLGVFAIACSHESTDLQKWAKLKCCPGLEVTFYAWPNILDILKDNERLRDELTDAKRINDARDELVYSRALIDLRDKMNLYAIEKAATEVREPPLTAAYVSLELSEITRESGEAERLGGSYSIEQVMDSLQTAPWDPEGVAGIAADPATLGKLSGPAADRAARRNNVLVLVGEAGRGKTTLLRYIAVQAAKDRERALQSSASLPEYRTAKRSLSWRERVPFYREVRLASDARPIEDLDQLACEILPSNPNRVAKDWPRSVVEAGRALVLLDGVDEVPDGQPRTTLLANIRALIQQNPQTLFVISSRPGAAEGLRRELAAMTPRESRVQALAGSKLQEFIVHWHGAVTGVAENLYKNEAQFTRVREIDDALQALPAKLDAARHIKALMATPLLAALVCAYHLDHKALPDNQTKLMTRLAVCLIDYHDRQRPGMPQWPAYSKLDENDKLAILESIAAEMVRRLEPTIRCNTDEPGGSADFDKHIQAFMQTAAWLHRPDLPDLRGGLKDRTGVWQELQRGVLSFIHNEFRDFLAARHLALRADEEQVYRAITRTFSDRDWHGLIFFVVTADRDKQRPGVADRLVADLLSFVNTPPTALLRKQVKTADEKKTVDDYLSLRRVAFRIAGAKPPVTPTVYAQLQKVRGSMLPPTTMEDAEIVSELGASAVSELKYNSTREPALRAVCAYALRLIDHEAARDARRVYAKHETDWGVLNELAQTIAVPELAFVPDAFVRHGAVFKMPDEMLTRLIRQAAGLLKDVRKEKALEMVCELQELHIESEDEALGLFGKRTMSDPPFSAVKLTVGLRAASEVSLAALASESSGLKRLTTLDLRNTLVTDEGVKELARANAGLKTLTSLYLSGTPLTDEGVKALAHADTGLKALTSLDLGNTRVTDEGVKALAHAETGLKALTSLDVPGTSVTDDGVKSLARENTGLPALASLWLNGTKVTDAGVRAVRARFPTIALYSPK